MSLKAYVACRQPKSGASASPKVEQEDRSESSGMAATCDL